MHVLDRLVRRRDFGLQLADASRALRHLPLQDLDLLLDLFVDHAIDHVHAAQFPRVRDRDRFRRDRVCEDAEAQDQQGPRSE